MYETYAIDLSTEDVAQMVERSLCMREARGSMPSISRASVMVFRFLQKNYCTLKLQSNSRSTKKKLRIAGWTNYLRDTLPQRGGIPNGRSLALLARGSKIKALHLHNLRPCVNVNCFLKKKYCILKLLNRSRLSLIVAD